MKFHILMRGPQASLLRDNISFVPETVMPQECRQQADIYAGVTPVLFRPS